MLFMVQEGFYFVGRKDYVLLNFNIEPLQALAFRAYQEDSRYAIEPLKQTFLYSGTSGLDISCLTMNERASSCATARMRHPLLFTLEHLPGSNSARQWFTRPGTSRQQMASAGNMCVKLVSESFFALFFFFGGGGGGGAWVLSIRLLRQNDIACTLS